MFVYVKEVCMSLSVYVKDDYMSVYVREICMCVCLCMYRRSVYVKEICMSLCMALLPPLL